MKNYCSINPVASTLFRTWEGQREDAGMNKQRFTLITATSSWRRKLKPWRPRYICILLVSTSSQTRGEVQTWCEQKLHLQSARAAHPVHYHYSLCLHCRQQVSSICNKKMVHRHVAKSCSYSAGRIDFRPFVSIQTRWPCFEDTPIMVYKVFYYHHKARGKLHPEWRHINQFPLLYEHWMMMRLSKDIVLTVLM